MSPSANLQQKVLWSLPESIPRQKAYTYIFLLFFTTLLIYFYSYPLNMENWSYIRMIKASNADSSYSERTNVSDFHKYDLATENIANDTVLLQKTFVSVKGSTSRSRLPRTTKLIPNKTSLHAQKFDELSEPYTSTSEAEFEKDESQSAGSFTSDPNHSVVSNESKSDYVKIVNEKADIQTTKDGRLLKTTGLISTRRLIKTSKLIPRESYLPFTKSHDISDSFHTTSMTEFENAKPKSTKSSTTRVITTEVISEEKKDTGKTTNEKTDIQTTVEELISTTHPPSESFTTTSTANFKSTQSKSTQASVTAASYAGVNNAAKSDAAKTENDMRDSQTTKSEHLSNISVKLYVNTTIKDKVASTVVSHEVNTSQISDLSSIKHESKIITSIDKIITTANEKHSFSTSNHAKIFEVEREETSFKVLTTGGSTSPAVLTDTTTVKEMKSFSTPVNQTSKTSSSVQKRFLVFSPHCKIPDIDPMHPSIQHLVEKNPPLDCSEDYKPLTRTERHVLILDEEAILKKTRVNNYTCCYKSIFRIHDGLSDDDVGFGPECIKIHNKTIIKDEFITVECKYNNGTLFYKEFHSFIFDKPKVEKRCRKRPKPQYSVLIIGVDAMSRMNMHRQLNATADYMLRKMDAIEMYGFNKVGDNTFPNLIPLLVGYDERELPSICWKSSDIPLDRCNFLWKRYAEKGYRTFYAEDSPHISSFNYVKDGFFHQPTDYYFRHFILAYEDALGRDKPLNCYLCVGSTSETEAVLHWTEQFASHFSERPYFAFSWINSLTHDFLNMGSSGDQMYENFFHTLHGSGALNKTIVILMGDHGMRWGAIRKTYIGRLEERLPMLLIALPKKFKKQYPKFAKVLKENSHRLVTPFDLHATLVHLLNLTDNWMLVNPDKAKEELQKNFTRRALSLFQPIPDDRSCDDAFIEEHWCTCESSLEVDIDSDEVKQVAKFLLSTINNLLSPMSKKCAVLALDSISDARLWQPSFEHEGHSSTDNIYTVIIHTNPSKAVFEGTVKLSQPETKATLLGTISRLNLYGNQSSCINHAVLKKYCYCL